VRKRIATAVVPGDIPKPPSNELPETSSEHQIHDSEWIVKMRAACEVAAHVLENAGKFKTIY
jgi:methionyl aminopeptidase